MCIPRSRLDFHPASRVEVAFDAPHMSSDGGVILLRQVDDRIGLTEQLTELVPDERTQSRVVHSRREQLRQRLYQIALGYEDCNDATTLRHDPALQVACDLEPRGQQRLSSQPTLTRFENAVDWRSIRKMLAWFERSYVESLPKDTSVVVLDIDSTHDPCHGRQQLAFFHGFYGEYIYHPVLVFDGTTGQFVTGILRPGNTHAARAGRSVLRRLVQRVREHLPDAQVVVRGDSGFAMPRLLDELERLNDELGDIHYLFGIARNQRLERELSVLWEPVQARFANNGKRPVRQFRSFMYAAASWPRERRIIGKAEVHAWGNNPRFVITSLEEFDGRLLYEAYCHRGAIENCIKDFKRGISGDRLSCHSFLANFFRFLLHAAAYRLLFALRNAVGEHSEELGRHEFETLRSRLLKVAVLVRQSVRRILLRLPRAFPLARPFRKTLIALGAEVRPA